MLPQDLDTQDELAPFRERFHIGDPDLIYLDGNSLGRLPLATSARLAHTVSHEWGERLIRGWNDGWIDLAARLGSQLAGLIGAQSDEVLLADSTSVNLYKLALAALQARPGRHKIVSDNLNFPSDLYILQGICRLLGPEYHVEVVESPDGVHGPLEGLKTAVDAQTALVTLSHTAFKSSYTYDLTAVTALAHQHGALVLWDLSHSAGALPIHLNRANADLAVGCTYKYLNGGPGAPAFLYVRRDLQEKLNNPISGWMGQRGAFEFGLDYEPAPGLTRFLSGTPSILGLTAVAPGLELLLEAGMERVRAKSVRQSEYLIALWREWLEPLGFRLNSPLDATRRGSHLSFGHPDAWRINQAYIQEMKVIPDFRKPDNIRLGLTPLYTSFTEIETAVLRLHTLLKENRQEKYDHVTATVT
jgi:kynureninase